MSDNLTKADFADIEARLMATMTKLELSTDPQVEAVRKLMGRNVEDVTPEQRKLIKETLWGLMYGHSKV